LMHRDLLDMCSIAHGAGLNVHISTNFSYELSDRSLLDIIQSGLTHLTVCVDGISQETYAKTRVGGRIDLVLSNLKRISRLRSEMKLRHPKIEVQYIKFQHNAHELEAAASLFKRWGVDYIYDFWGCLHNYTDHEPGKYEVYSPKRSAILPLCGWPYYATLVRWNGDVIPCCNYRIWAQHAENGDKRTIENLFRSSLLEVWNSAGYRAVRKIVSNPMSSISDHSSAFCNGCSVVYNTGIDALRRVGNKYKFEDVYPLIS